MRHAISDTGPLNYLVLIEQEALLPQLIGQVAVPEVVRRELSHPASPAAVRGWIAAPPSWLEVKWAPEYPTPSLDGLDDGERAVITLAGSTAVNLILTDDRSGVQAARALGFTVTGTLGLLALAGHRNLLDFPDAIARRRTTNFRCRPALLDVLLDQHRRESNSEG